MRVICIKDFTACLKGVDAGNNPKFGEIVTAHQCRVWENGYSIDEYLFDFDGKGQSFSKANFTPVSSIDETEFERNYKKELV